MTSVCVCRYFMVNSEGKTVAQQKGVFRSNCMDCLDRTNVIQSLLARRSLQSQLQVFKLTAAVTLQDGAALARLPRGFVMVLA